MPEGKHHVRECSTFAYALTVEDRKLPSSCSQTLIHPVSKTHDCLPANVPSILPLVTFHNCNYTKNDVTTIREFYGQNHWRRCHSGQEGMWRGRHCVLCDQEPTAFSRYIYIWNQNNGHHPLGSHNAGSCLNKQIKKKNLLSHSPEVRKATSKVLVQSWAFLKALTENCPCFSLAPWADRATPGVLFSLRLHHSYLWPSVFTAASPVFLSLPTDIL